LFMHRKIEKPYHIDYAFLSASMINQNSIEVGKPEKWLEYSDHMPVIFSVSS